MTYETYVNWWILFAYILTMHQKHFTSTLMLLMGYAHAFCVLMYCSLMNNICLYTYSSTHLCILYKHTDVMYGPYTCFICVLIYNSLMDNNSCVYTHNASTQCAYSTMTLMLLMGHTRAFHAYLYLQWVCSDNTSDGDKWWH